MKQIFYKEGWLPQNNLLYIAILNNKLMSRFKKQAQTAYDRLEQSVATLENLIKRGQTGDALRYINEGQFKDCMDYLQNIIEIEADGEYQSKTGFLG